MARSAATTGRWCPRAPSRQRPVKPRRQPRSNPIVASNSADETPAGTPEPAPTPTPERKTNVAALSEGPPQADIAKSVQSELRRVGCLKADADGDWNTTSQRSLTLFNRYAKTRLDTKVASNDALDAIKQKSSRVCPLACEHGFEADGDHCSKIVCGEGSFLNDDNECEKRRGKEPVVRRVRPEARPMPEARQYPQARQAIVVRPSVRDPSRSSTGRPLTGLERQQGCNSYQAIMSGVCP